jgi:hypothetical protein
LAPELILAKNAAGTRADPVIVVNTVTGARIGIFFQTASQDDDPRGEIMSEWINNWYLPKLGGPKTVARAPSPKDGSMIDQTSVQASWRAGDSANCTMSISAIRDEVGAPRGHGLYVGRQAVTKLPMAWPAVRPHGLVRQDLPLASMRSTTVTRQPVKDYLELPIGR